MATKTKDSQFRKQVCENMEVYAKAYLDTDIKTDILETEAVILDSINYVGEPIDYKTFYDILRKFDIKTTMLDPVLLLSFLKDEYRQYYEDGIIKNILKNKDCYACTESLYFDEEDSVDILNSYLSYISRVNNLEEDIEKSNNSKVKRIERRLR